MIGPTAILVALIVLTIVLAAVFLVRPSITMGTTGKILAFVALCVLPALCIGAGMSTHMQRSEQTQFCISCHSMETLRKKPLRGRSEVRPAAAISRITECPADHGLLCLPCRLHDLWSYEGQAQGMTRIYMQYVSTPPKTIHISGGYNNLQCLHCHAGARSFEENPVHVAIMDSLKTNQLSCISSGCHDTVHNASEVDHLKMWRPGQ